MSLLAKLQIGENSTGLYNDEYLVAGCSYRFSRKHNGRRPDRDVRMVHSANQPLRSDRI